MALKVQLVDGATPLVMDRGDRAVPIGVNAEQIREMTNRERFFYDLGFQDGANGQPRRPIPPPRIEPAPPRSQPPPSRNQPAPSQNNFCDGSLGLCMG